MPIGDEIFKRLRLATEAELLAFAKPLGATLSADRELNVIELSKEYRADATNSFANIFRADHAAEYREILLQVAKAAAKEAGWNPPTIKDTAREPWIEEYIGQALAFAANPAKDKLSVPDKAAARERAEATLEGSVERESHVQLAALSVAAMATAGALATNSAVTAAAVTAAGAFTAATALVGVVPLLVVGGAYSLAGPSMKKVVPATLVLIHIRRRAELEQKLLSLPSS